MSDRQFRIAVDMDEVLADSQAKLLRRYEAWSGSKIDAKEILGKKLDEWVPSDHKRIIHGFSNDPGFYADLPIIEGAQDAMNTLCDQCDIFVVSAATEFPTSMIDKYHWLNKNFPRIGWRKMVFCGQKSIIDADYLIDDHSPHFLNFKGKGILFEAPHNVFNTYLPRSKSWSDVLNFLRAEKVIAPN